MLKYVFIVLCSCMFVIACSSQPAKVQKEQVTILPATYNATVDLEGVEGDVKAYSAVSQVSFTLEDDNTFIYSVRAMGKAIDDVGQWEVRGDSLHIFNLEKGPDSAFKLEKVSDTEYKISGPNKFILTKTERITPIQN